ncbi:MAG: hypothetical protein CVU46_09630 [Chloroflexi bacterium HGW-Chloroflexi-8]|jgi:hypothetical protein|nr:MAG: hypothetical protein CVU46_09630 [Chloroflexi bacterium HGW-Chloroflexi-8]
MESNSQTQYSTWDQIKDDSKRLLNTLEKAIDQSAENLSKLVLITLEPEERKQLEKLVDSKLVSNIKDAASMMIQEGIKARSDLFTQINQTNGDIEKLKNQLEVNFSTKKSE